MEDHGHEKIDRRLKEESILAMAMELNQQLAEESEAMEERNLSAPAASESNSTAEDLLDSLEDSNNENQEGL